MMRGGRREEGGRKKISRNCVGHPFPLPLFSAPWRIVTRRRHLPYPPPRLSRLNARRGVVKLTIQHPPLIFTVTRPRSTPSILIFCRVMQFFSSSSSFLLFFACLLLWIMGNLVDARLVRSKCTIKVVFRDVFLEIEIK